MGSMERTGVSRGVESRDGDYSLIGRVGWLCFFVGAVC